MPQTLECIVKYLLYAWVCILFGHHLMLQERSPSHWGFSWTKHFENSSWIISQFIYVHLIDKTNVVSLLRVGNQAS